MEKAILREYRRRRVVALHWALQGRSRHEKNMRRAIEPLASARTVAAFDANPNVRLRVEYDPHSCIDDLAGDMFNPKYDGLTHSQRERERKAFIDRVNDEGATGIIGEYFDGEDWQHADSVWGFIGDDWKDSGYDVDIMRATLDAYGAHAESQARDVESERPDMYGVRA
jgi:hypothetical protein